MKRVFFLYPYPPGGNMQKQGVYLKYMPSKGQGCSLQATHTTTGMVS